MGKSHRERLARILAGKETPIANKVRETITNVGVATVKTYSTSNQIKFLADSLHSGRLTNNKLRLALGDKSPEEMHKGALKLRDKSRAITVDALLEEYRGDKAFQELAAEVGLDEGYFEKLAGKEADKW